MDKILYNSYLQDVFQHVKSRNRSFNYYYLHMMFHNFHHYAWHQHGKLCLSHTVRSKHRFNVKNCIHFKPVHNRTASSYLKNYLFLWQKCHLKVSGTRLSCPTFWWLQICILYNSLHNNSLKPNNGNYVPRAVLRRAAALTTLSLAFLQTFERVSADLLSYTVDLELIVWQKCMWFNPGRIFPVAYLPTGYVFRHSSL